MENSGIPSQNPESGHLPTKDEWSDVVSKATEQVRLETEAEAEPDGPPTASLVVFGIIVSVLVALWVPKLAPDAGVAALPLSDQGEDLRLEAGVLVQEIEAYRMERGELPNPELFAPYLTSGYDYEITDTRRGRYVVRRRSGDIEVAYDGTLSLSLWLLIGGVSTLGGAS